VNSINAFPLPLGLLVRVNQDVVLCAVHEVLDTSRTDPAPAAPPTVTAVSASEEEGGPFCETVIGARPGIRMKAVRAAPVVLAVKVKLMVPLAVPVMVSQDWSLVAPAEREAGRICAEPLPAVCGSVLPVGPA
jgi:hypothetical protein